MMYKQKYCLNKLINACLLLTGLIIHNHSVALTTDQDQPIEIEADTAELDDQKGVTTYTGNVIVTQGSIRMTGDKMTVYYTKDNDLDTVIMEGRPATYRQLPDKSEDYDEAEALRMEYYGLKNLIVLINNAVVKQKDVRFSGSRIEYDTEHSQIRARGQAESGAEKSSGSGGRVKITIKPKKKE